MKKAILLIIDMINDGFNDWDPANRSALTSHINQLSEFFRKEGLPVVWVRQEFAPDLNDAFLEMRKRNIQMYIKGTSGAEILSELRRDPRDLEIVKKRYSAFFGTNLDETLAAHKPQFVVLAGINTHACIRTTAIDSYQRDLETILAVDCVQSYNSAWHASSLEYLDSRVATLKTNVELMKILS
ncbi:MAG: cysteine hydrolase family protein [Bdellovibrionales bacterium]